MNENYEEFNGKTSMKLFVLFGISVASFWKLMPSPHCIGMKRLETIKTKNSFSAQ